MSGSPFQTFYMLFKTNAKEAIKDMKDAQKTSDDLTAHVKKTKDETKQLGEAFTEAVEGATKALAAYVSFNAMKNGIINAQKQNRELAIQADLWNQNAQAIQGYGNAVKATGGDMNALMGSYDAKRREAASLGRASPELGDWLRHLNRMVQGLNAQDAENYLDRAGLDVGAHPLVRQTPEEFEKMAKLGEEQARNDKQASEAAKAYGKSVDNLTNSLRGFWTEIGSYVLPIVGKFVDALAFFFKTVSQNGVAAVAMFGLMAGASIAFSVAAPGVIAGILGIGGAAAGVMGTLGAFLGILLRLSKVAAIIGFAAWLPGASKRGGADLGHWINRRLGRGDANGVLPGDPTGGGGAAGSGTAMQYLMSKYGLDANHAAGIVANMNAESGGNPGAVGDGGQARGAFQWHPDRQAGILAGTNIDVTKDPSLYKHLDAAMWELGKRGQLDGFKATGSAYDAGAYFSSQFERPAAGAYEAMRRGRAAMDIAGQTPFASQSGFGGGGSGGNNVTIGKVEVNTQATDADGMARAASSALQRQIGNVFAQNNDAVAY